MQVQRQTQLLIIDPQNDFCDLPESWHGFDPVTGQTLSPSLPVPGAHADMLRVAALIRAAQAHLDQIYITLDSHHRVDIAHPPFWMQADGADVLPFTAISAQQVRDGVFRPRDPNASARVQAYVDDLEAQGRYTLMIWPVHCEIGSWGHNVHAEVKAAYNAWEESQLRCVGHILKGANPWTEHYSAMQAEVPDAQDPATQFNQVLLDGLLQADLLLIAGEASSHCVRATTEHIVNHLPPGRASSVVLLTDCMSPVSGFEAQHEAFLADMHQCGVRLSNSANILLELQAKA